MPALRDALLRISPSVRAWLELIEDGEARIVTYGAAGTDMPVLYTTVGISGDVAFQVHRGHWNGLTTDGRTAIAAAHRSSIATQMNRLAAPEAALQRVAFAIRCACVGLPGASGAAGSAAMLPDSVGAFVAPLLGILTGPVLGLSTGMVIGGLLLKPARWIGQWVIAHELRKLTG